MAHQFESGVFFHGQPAWHGLGTVLDGTQPARQAFATANADWQVDGLPIFDAAGQPIDGYQAITRGDTGSVLSVQRSTYTIVQNEQLIRLAEALREDAIMDAVVVLAEGRKVAFTARVVGAEAEALKGDPVHQYLVGTTSHDGSVAFQALFSPVRVVCANTLSAALGQAQAAERKGKGKRFAIRHTTNANALIERLPEIIDMKRQQFTASIAELQQMAATPCTDKQFSAYCAAVFADQLAGTVNDRRGDASTARPKTISDLPAWDSLANKFAGDAIGSDIPGVKGTMWAAYNAVTEYFTHDAGRTLDETEAARKRLESLWWGSAANSITKAHTLALAAV